MSAPIVIDPAVRHTTTIILPSFSSAPGRLSLPGLALLALAWLLMAWPALAQVAPVVAGQVVDPAGAVVAGARVTLLGPDENARTTREVLTDERGRFHWDGIDEGSYVLTVEVPGFTPAVRDLVVPSDVAADLTIELHVASLNQAITVEGSGHASVARTSAPATDLETNVSVVGADTLQTFAVNDLVTALQQVPNVNAYTQYGAYEYYSFRGFSDSVQTVDGVRNEGNRVRSQLAHVDRVEVLKGPASVLYGADAIGATVNLVLKRPTALRTYDASAGVGSWQTTRVSAGTGGRLAGSARLLYRIDAGADRSEGYRHDASARLNVTSTATWLVSNRDQIDLRYSGHRNDLGADSGIPLQTLADGARVIPHIPRNRRFNTPDDFARSTDHNLRAAYTRPVTDTLTLRTVLSRRVYDDDYWVAETLEADASNAVYREFLYFKHERRPWFAQVELNGIVRAGFDHDLLVGWEHQNYHTRTARSDDASRATTPIDLFDPVETHVNWTSFPVSRYDHTRLLTHAAYVQDRIGLTRHVTAVGGIRFDQLTRHTNRNPVIDGIETPVAPDRRRSSAVSYRTGVVYQPTAAVDIFVQHGTAFRPNYNLQPDGSPIDPETGRQVEAGYRLRVAGRRLDLTASFFRITKANIAISRPGGFFDMAGGIRSQGLEHEVEWRPSALVRLTAGYGYTDAVYTNYETTRGDLSGNRRPRTPRHSANISAALVFDNGLSLSVNGQTRGRQFLDDANTLSLEGYGLLNLALGYAHGPLHYGLTISNFTNTSYWASALGDAQLYPGEPVRVMATLRLLSR